MRISDWSSDVCSSDLTNQAESYFSRVRKAVAGIHHRMSARYLDGYVADLAWREDMGQHSPSWRYKAALAKALAHAGSRKLTGDWPGNKPAERLGRKPMEA